MSRTYLKLKYLKNITINIIKMYKKSFIIPFVHKLDVVLPKSMLCFKELKRK